MPPKVDLTFPGQPKIPQFIHSTDDELLFGGARGGGKTESILWDVYVKANGFAKANIPVTLAVFRRRNRQLEQTLIQRALQRYDWPAEWFHSSTNAWHIPLQDGTGYVQVLYGHAHNPDDAFSYKSEEWAMLYIDQAEEFTGEMITALMGNLRSSHPRVRPMTRLCANPGGPGQAWLMDNFVEPVDEDTDEPLDVDPQDGFTVRVETEVDGRPYSVDRTRRYIVSKVSDNPYLGAEYVGQLMRQAPHMRAGWLDADWHSSSIIMYPDFSKRTHLVKLADLPDMTGWQHHVSVDYGYAAPFCALFAARHPKTRKLVVYDEIYLRGATAEQQGKLVGQRMLEHKHYYRLVTLDYQMWARESNGSTPAFHFRNGLKAATGHNRPLVQASKERVINIEGIHHRLAIESDGEPAMKVSERCRNLIKELQTLEPDPDDQRDVLSKRATRDHAHDALMYLLASYGGTVERPVGYRITQRERKTA